MTAPRDEPPRDAWLREALRHAPDADAAPSPELSAAILRRARDAVTAGARPAEPSHPLLQLWAWLARPPVAAGFASVTLATLVGVMWWGRPLDDALPRPESPAATVAQSPAPAAAVAAPLEPAAAPGAQKDADRATTQVAKEAPRAVAPRREDAARASTERARAAAADEPRARDLAAAAPPAPAPVSPPAAAPAPPAAGNTTKPAVAEASDDAAAQRGASAQGLAKAAPAATLSTRRQEAANVVPVIDQPERWTWQRDGTEQAMTPAVQRWLAQLGSAARWRTADAPAPADDAAVLRLWRDGTLRATLQLGRGAVWLTPADGPPKWAPLTPEAAAALQAALIAATP